MTNVTDTQCVEYRRKEARALVDKFNPMFEKLTEAMHKLENKLWIHANELTNIWDKLESHMDREESMQHSMKKTIDDIHARVSKNANTRVSKSELRWIIWILFAGFTLTAWYMIAQIDKHNDWMNEIKQKLYIIEAKK